LLVTTGGSPVMQDHKTGDSMEEEVEEILESLRPMLIQDGGNVELVEVEDGVVKVRLVGACVSCSSSLMTLKMGIEKALKKAIPMVRCVESVE
jgi:Fe-S cluster biogenesis protein NfuA|tara:strand:- start:35 stop:313 length:279 start_codon:yes stop_codon:yes gene_type:complete